MSDPLPLTRPPAGPRFDDVEQRRVHDALAEEARCANKAVLFCVLAKAAITSVTVAFDGAGDSGQIESITAYAGETVVDLPDESIAMRKPRPDGLGLEQRTSPIADAIETLAYDYLEETHGGWEIEDGAFGEFHFDVTARTIRLAYSERVMKTLYSEHAF